MYPDFSGPPEPCKDTCAAKGSATHQPGFYFSLPGVRSRRAGKGNARTWRRSEGGLAGPPLARGPPEATSRPAGRHTAHPSPPRRRTPAEPTLQEARRVSRPRAGHVFQRQGPHLLLRADAQRNPEARTVPERGYEAKGQRVPPLGCGSGLHVRDSGPGASFRPRFPLSHVRG